MIFVSKKGRQNINKHKDSFNSKIAFKLSLNFGISLLIFASIIGCIFFFLFQQQTLKIHRTEMERRALDIAETFSGFMQMGSKRGTGYGAYMRFVGDIAGTDVWIIDRDLNLTTPYSGGHASSQTGHHIYQYADLPPNAEELIQEVFTDQIVFSQEFSQVLSQLTLTVGVPINVSGSTEGVVLLHYPIKGSNQAFWQGIAILGISIFVALGISFVVAIIFSYLFTKPMATINKNALRLANGEYDVRNNFREGVNPSRPPDEIGQLAETLDQLAVRLKSADEESSRLEQLRRDFVANVSHELKTPVTVMRGSLEALVDGIVSDEETVEEYHKQMLTEAKFLQRLVGDLLDLSRLQNTDFVIEKERLVFSEVISDAMRSASQLARQKQVTISLENIDETKMEIMGDYVRLRQMMLIVLDNAVKFSPVGEEVVVSIQNNRIGVTDRGAGISQQDIPYLFERFYKAHTEDNKSGTGLGLAIAKQIAERHNITIKAESELLKGTTIWFLL